jgi:hypothetical protein
MDRNTFIHALKLACWRPDAVSNARLPVLQKTTGPFEGPWTDGLKVGHVVVGLTVLHECPHIANQEFFLIITFSLFFQISIWHTKLGGKDFSSGMVKQPKETQYILPLFTR